MQARSFTAIRKKAIFQAEIILLFPLFAATVQGATTVQGIYFEHKDWELACDNTRTCRAVGYQDDEGKPVSMLLTRKAGPNTPVAIELQALIDSFDEEAPAEMRFQIGELVIPELPLKKELPQEITVKLLAVMPDSEQAILSREKQQWLLSLAGMKAVLLKMDEFQGRIGTPGALIQKSDKPEDKVLPPIPEKIFIIPPIPPTTAQDKDVLAALENFFDQECDTRELDREYCKRSRSVYRVSKDKLLVSQPAWQAAYNMGSSFWLLNDKPPYHPRPAQNDEEADEGASGYDNGVIFSVNKGRGLGDCLYYASWVWTGNAFEKAEQGSTGMCKGFPGGAWELPTTVSRVINKNE